VRARQRQHVNPLGFGFETFRGERPALRPGCRTEVEVGCADAQFLFERAALDPNANYVGIEIRDFLVDEVNRLAAKRGVPVQSVFCNANHHLGDLFAPASVDQVYVNFPDPWFKRRHRKRRMVDASLVRHIHAILRPGGALFFQSDVWEVALDALDVFERHDELFDNRAGDWAFWKEGNPYGVRSWREQNCEREEMPVWRLMYERH
jgi:tRNA (guanine-N7-)-methyltransferase